MKDFPLHIRAEVGTHIYRTVDFCTYAQQLRYDDELHLLQYWLALYFSAKAGL